MIEDYKLDTQGTIDLLQNENQALKKEINRLIILVKDMQEDYRKLKEKYDKLLNEK